MTEVKATDIYMAGEDFKALLAALNMASLMLEELEIHELPVMDLDRDQAIPRTEVTHVIHEGHMAASRAKYRP